MAEHSAPGLPSLKLIISIYSSAHGISQWIVHPPTLQTSNTLGVNQCHHEGGHASRTSTSDSETLTLWGCIFLQLLKTYLTILFLHLSISETTTYPNPPVSSNKQDPAPQQNWVSTKEGDTTARFAQTPSSSKEKEIPSFLSWKGSSHV